MGIEVANEMWVLAATPNGGWTPAAQALIVWTLIKAGKASAGGTKILVEKIEWEVPVPLCVFAGYTHTKKGAPVVPITATAVKVRCDSKFVLRKGDQGSCAGEFTLNVSPFTVVPCSCAFQISDAGQVKVFAA